MARPIVEAIDEVEEETRQAPVPGDDWIMIPMAAPTYKALSDAAAKKNMTVAQLFARAITIAIEEE